MAYAGRHLHARRLALFEHDSPPKYQNINCTVVLRRQECRCANNSTTSKFRTMKKYLRSPLDPGFSALELYTDDELFLIKFNVCFVTNIQDLC